MEDRQAGFGGWGFRNINQAVIKGLNPKQETYHLLYLFAINRHTHGRFQLIYNELAPAKINLGLHVLRKRPDGYHDIETVFYRVGWADAIQIEPAQGLTMTCSDPMLPVDEGNLCIRAAKALQAHSGTSLGAQIHLEKHIPYGAGLGGGSSDAATVLRVLDTMWDLNIPRQDLFDIASTLGADVPFFLGEPLALGTGIGTTLAALNCPGSKHFEKTLWPFLIVVPRVHVATAAAYAGIHPCASDRPDLVPLVCSGDMIQWKRHLRNDFEASVFEAYPVIRTVRDQMYAFGAGYATMSGSGAACVGFFEETKQADQAAEAAVMAGHIVWKSYRE